MQGKETRDAKPLGCGFVSPSYATAGLFSCKENQRGICCKERNRSVAAAPLRQCHRKHKKRCEHQKKSCTHGCSRKSFQRSCMKCQRCSAVTICGTFSSASECGNAPLHIALEIHS